jgi:hypothetical protein
MTQARAESKAAFVPVKGSNSATPMPPVTPPAAGRQLSGAASAVESSISPIPAKGRRSPSNQQARSAADSSKSARIAVSESRRRNPPAFREVLKGTPALAAGTMVAGSQDLPASIETAKVSCLTLRVSESEQARIQACAAQANLSLSAYLRQCALGVDELRSQVEIALVQLRDTPVSAPVAAPVPTIAPPGIAAIPGILKRFLHQCFRREKKSQPSTGLMTS